MSVLSQLHMSTLGETNIEVKNEPTRFYAKEPLALGPDRTVWISFHGRGIDFEKLNKMIIINSKTIASQEKTIFCLENACKQTSILL